MNLEFILELAATYDEDYQYSLEDRWLSLNASIDFTGCFDSDIGTIISHWTQNTKIYLRHMGTDTSILKKKLIRIDLTAPKGTPYTPSGTVMGFPNTKRIW